MNKFPFGRTFLLGFGFLGISVVWPIFNQFIPIFLQAGNPAFEGRTDVMGFGLSPAWALFIMTWDNIINVFVQPWVGERSDRIHTSLDPDRTPLATCAGHGCRDGCAAAGTSTWTAPARS